MNEAPQQAQVCYVDGHVRVYHAEQTKLPRHFVSRQRLCLRAAVDYWVNAMDGQPFLVVHQDVDPGLIKVLETQILPRLSEDIPAQPTPDALAADPRIAALTYRKRPGDDWPVAEFTPHEVRLVGGEVVTMQLAERGVFLGNLIWVREIRRLTISGHQTAIVTTKYHGDLTHIAAAMFARWCQENFFVPICVNTMD